MFKYTYSGITQKLHKYPPNINDEDYLGIINGIFIVFFTQNGIKVESK